MKIRTVRDILDILLPFAFVLWGMILVAGIIFPQHPIISMLCALMGVVVAIGLIHYCTA